ncbi:tyrosine-type recombinase/integrase [Tetragenococcus koreensis]|uniref:tyrosine-type recombinase/integrase n=1 Tax=Tetragenococcus koreensis TaxID=290335 RepID=UPI001F2D1B3E|nr:tyrosine-type recombinase/integrase [Tetragenococcus koreensis]MCF1620849.1 tyrosine-type recombinase/integrase [Tetragenococcus koreensis]MCF1658363.1 tyrosine-type recombinase/integrase [Tetragenococcus koreensis]
MHGLRHTHASVMIYKGTDILAVSKHLGHKSLNVTMSTYSHAIKELKEREDEKIKSIMDDN